MSSLDHAATRRNNYPPTVAVTHDDDQLTHGGREVRRRARWMSTATCNLIACLAGLGPALERGR